MLLEHTKLFLIQAFPNSSFIANKLIKHSKKEYVCLSVAAVTTFFIWRLYKRSIRKTSTVDPAYLPPLLKGGNPLFGHLLGLRKDPGKFLDHARDTMGPCYVISIPGQGNLTVVSDDLIGDVMKSSKNFSFDRGIQLIIPALGVLQESYKHKHVAEKISPKGKHPVSYPIKQFFKPNQIHIYSERIKDATTTALDNELVLQKGEEKLVDTLQLLTILVANISCRCFAGSKIGRDKDLIAGMATFTQKIITAGLFLAVLPGWLGRFAVRNFFSVEPEMDIIMKLLVPELQKIRDGESSSDDEVTFSPMTLVVPKEDGSLRSVEDAAYHFNGVALASIHTTSHFATFALHELSASPSLLKDLRNEIATLGDNRTPEAISALPLMDSFLREVLRVDVDYLGMHHLTLKDTVMSSGHIIPEGTLVVSALEQALRADRFLQVDEDTGELFKGASPLNVFDGYRFVDRNMKATSIGSDHLIFGLGAHACPGRYFAVNEIKYILAEIISRFNIKSKSGKRAKDNIVFGMTKFPPSEHLVFEGL